MTSGLKLRAEDGEDIATVAACLQDALVPVGDMDFLSADGRFVLVANRFCWENCTEAADQPWTPPPEGDQPAAPGPEVPDVMFEACKTYQRVNCGVSFDGVAKVRRRGIDPREHARILELLTFETEPGAITLVFAGGAAIRLEGASIVCRMEDIGEPWPTLWRPRHALGT